MRRLLSLVCPLLLAACGGGGGGGANGGGSGGGTSGGVDNSWLSFSPTVSEVTAYAGESTSFTITATSSKVIDGVFNLAVIDGRGVVSTDLDVRNPSPLTYTASLKVASTLAAGTYEGRFEVRLCRDVPTTCAQPIAGSPWQVPYKITVQPVSNLTPLTSLTGAAGWSTYQGNAAHTGFVDASVSASNFNRRWVRDIMAGAVSTDSGRVFVSGPENRSLPLRALSEHDGSDLWQLSTAKVLISGPASAGGKVWVLAQPTDFGSAGWEFWAIDAATGTQLTRAPLDSDVFQSPRLAPVPDGGSVYFAADTGISIGRRSQSDGKPEWLHFAYSNRIERWTPTVGGGWAMVFDLGSLHVTDLATGTQSFDIQGPKPLSGSGVWRANGAPALGPNGLAYATAYNTPFGSQYGAGQLVAFDLNARSVRWSSSLNTVRSNPVLARGVVYVTLDSRTLLAVDAATGAELWRWDVPKPAVDPSAPTSVPGSYGPDAPLLVVGDYAFMGVDQMTYAVDLRTHKLAWQYPLSGQMAVSANGVLFISSDQNGVGNVSKLVAINLR
ncbi:PQQ-binding-like beta-propeller repeat protein [Roseateles cellulosilyticus]|uniref:PQQ-binding-like beta-propeller repeat protein n=1 Tax=Pelomonas cellulosilytica TaxID=2906762 RepID=A0ABS8Y1U4_9BURK|nr:PQQ-binding-like beta-propeller repeat protein [Pelomonas sp. P8]MCE4557026.1 PQQ-binding-like beta-propeller repeat protein [Pelomonas sp. P8]